MSDRVETACQAWARWHFDGRPNAPTAVLGSECHVEWDNDRPFAECVDMAIIEVAKTYLPVRSLQALLKWVYFDGKALREFRICPGPPPPIEFSDLVQHAQRRIIAAHVALTWEIETVLDREAARFVKPKICEVA